MGWGLGVGWCPSAGSTSGNCLNRTEVYNSKKAGFHVHVVMWTNSASVSSQKSEAIKKVWRITWVASKMQNSSVLFLNTKFSMYIYQDLLKSRYLHVMRYLCYIILVAEF